MKLNVYQTFKILLVCFLLTDSIRCSKTETEGRFLMKAGFLKHKKATTNASKPSVPVAKNSTPKAKLEAMSLIQKSESAKNLVALKSRQADMSSVDALAQQLGNQPANPTDPAPLDLNIGTGPIWVTGWIKYFKYYPSMKTRDLTPQNTPRQFMVNPDYNEQYKINPKFDKKEMSKDEMQVEQNVYITDKNKFFAKLMKDQIVIVSSRKVR